MAASASEVRKFAIAALAWSARQDPRTTSAFTQAKTMVLREFAGNDPALAVIGQIPSQAAALAQARRVLDEDPFDTSADGSFNEAVENLQASTEQLILLAQRHR